PVTCRVDPDQSALRRMPEGVLDEDPADLEHALLVGQRDRALLCAAGNQGMTGCSRDRTELVRERPRDGVERDELALDLELPGVEAREIEELRRQLRQPLDLVAHRGQELAPGLLVELLVGEQLEEAPEREERGAELVRRVGNELPPGVLELRELLPHPIERPGDLTDLVRPAIDDRLVETARRDALRSGLEAPQAPRE